MRYFTQKSWETYQTARKTPYIERDYFDTYNYEAGITTLRLMKIDILPMGWISIAPPNIIIISRRPRIKNFKGLVILPEAVNPRYNLNALMGYALDDVKNLLNALFGEGKNG